MRRTLIGLSVALGLLMTIAMTSCTPPHRGGGGPKLPPAGCYGTFPITPRYFNGMLGVDNLKMYALGSIDCTSAPMSLATAVYALDEPTANDACEKIGKGVVVTGGPIPGSGDLDAQGYTGLKNLWECFVKDTP
jgi:hypothetical protein